MIEHLQNGYSVERGVKDPQAYAGEELKDRLFQRGNPSIEFYVYAGLPLEAFYTISMLWHLGHAAGEAYGRADQQRVMRLAIGLKE